MEVELLNKTEKLKNLSKEELFLYIILCTAQHLNINFISIKNIKDIYSSVCPKKITLKFLENSLLKLTDLHLINREIIRITGQGIYLNEENFNC